MSECCDIPSHLSLFPTELLIYIFKFLPARKLIACRLVCMRWKEVIDDVSSDENMWEEHCKRDFKTLYQDAKKKSYSCRLWFDVYQSLALWSSLRYATEVRDEFCHSSVIADEIRDLAILKNGVAYVHKRGSVAYYDISTLELSEPSPLYGELSKYKEWDDLVLSLGVQLHFRIIKKVKEDSNLKSDSKGNEVVIPRTRQFLRFGNIVYFINYNSTISYCNIDNELIAKDLPRIENETVVTLSLYKGVLHIITVERNVYKCENNTLVRLFGLESKQSNLFDCLWRYEFIENIDWRIFYLWVISMEIIIPEGPLRYICMMKVYGDTFFIGCKKGVFLIYYKPYTNGHLDFTKHNPVKRYRFTEREDIPVLSLHPILKLDIAEIKGGHKLLIAMPKKVITITYNHSFEVTKSKAVVPYVKPVPILPL